MVNPWKTYVKLSAVLMGSHGLTKGSLAWLNYPAQIMFKSTKVSLLDFVSQNIFEKASMFSNYSIINFIDSGLFKFIKSK